MAEGEKFDIKKMATSPLTGIYWVKCLMFGLGIFCIVIIGYAVYKAYFKKPLPSQEIHAEAGSNVKIIQYNDRKKILIPFVEAYVGQESGSDLDTGIRAGVRFEW